MKASYTLSKNENGVTITTPLRGYDVLYQPTLNKGSAFNAQERETFGLHGILPPHVSTLKEQCQRTYQRIQKKKTDLEKYTTLLSLQHRNEVLYYRFLMDHLAEAMPLVYTPTVGQACEEFSQIFRRSKGFWITPDDRGHIQERLKNAPVQDVRLIVATDNESILGIGDQGAGGIAISIGKLALYCVAAGIHPTQVLPISLDVGTNNNRLLQDPLYIGYKKARLTGEPYHALVDEFVEAVKVQFPKALIQWEDFRKQNAFDILDRHKNNVLSFNDDIQGTASVALSGILTGCSIKKESLKQQRILIMGAGAAGIGIARLIEQTLQLEHPEVTPMDHLALTDSQGLLYQGRARMDPYKANFGWSAEQMEKAGITAETSKDLHAMIDAFKPTVVIGTSGQQGIIDQKMVEQMCKISQRPMIMPFSNPNHLSEAHPSDVIEWSQGKALIATGSPFPSYHYENKEYVISQGNNVFIFPGVGLSSILGNHSCIDAKVFFTASKALSNCVTAEEKEKGMLFPDIQRLRSVTRQIAIETLCDIQDLSKDQARQIVDDFMWEPSYPNLVAE